MVKIDEKTKCPECGSVWSKITIDENFHKVRSRVCFDGCICDKEVLKDYGYSHKMKLKHDMRQKNKSKEL